VNLQSAPPAKSSNTLSTTATPSQSYSAATDIEGAFQIRGVAPGEYYILGRLAGYLSPYDLASSEFQGDSSLSSRALDVALTRIIVEADHTTTANLILARGASLGGTVRYDDGGLAINVPTHLFRKDGTGMWKPYRNSVGASALSPLGFSPHTDERGRFNDPGLPPGTYIIEATLPETTVVPTTILGRQSLNINITTGNALQVFDGDKYRLRDATPIELREGQDRPDIDIVLPTSGLHAIHGFVTAKSDGRSVTDGTVRLLDPDDRTTLRETALQDDGAFVFNYVVNGSYLVQIEAKADARASKPLVGYEPFTSQLLVETDIPNLVYTLTSAKH
jgi:hypothetical protein